MVGLVSLCEYCGRNMVEGVSCTVPTLLIDDDGWLVEYVRVVFGKEEAHEDTRFDWCPDCAAPPGGLHHFICDWEQCPRCGGQLLGCECEVQPMKNVVPEIYSLRDVNTPQLAALPYLS